MTGGSVREDVVGVEMYRNQEQGAAGVSGASHWFPEFVSNSGRITDFICDRIYRRNIRNEAGMSRVRIFFIGFSKLSFVSLCDC
jgi:hypothetical protein